MTAFTALTGGLNNDFYNSIGGRMFLDEAPQDIEFPYCVFMVVSALPERTFTEYFTDALIQFSLFSTSATEAEIGDMYSYLKALYDEKPLTVSGSTLLWMRESNLATMIEDIQTPSAGASAVKHWAVDFNLYTQES